MYYTQNNFPAKSDHDLMTQLYILQNDKTILTNELKKKEKEVSFWKNLRTDLYNSTMQQNMNIFLEKSKDRFI